MIYAFLVACAVYFFIKAKLYNFFVESEAANKHFRLEK